MSVKQQLMTAEDLYALPEMGGRSLELIDGEVIEVSPASLRHGLIATRLAGILADFARQHNLGLVSGDNVGYVLRREPDTMRAPDVSFIARERVPESDDLDRYVEGAPTLAVEPVSFYGLATDLHLRVRDYLRSGTRLVWVLWSDTRSISIHRPDGTSAELGPDATLDGSDVLPGFSVTVGDLFEIR